LADGLTAPQWIYLGAVACYLLFFALFLRLFWWKRYADRNFWRARPADLTVEEIRERAAEANLALPRFSILVPARNEADVIERTVDHMSRLRYPPDLYEIVVITDEKEQIAADRQRPVTVGASIAAIAQSFCPYAHETREGGLVLAMLARLAAERLDDLHRRCGESDGTALLQSIPAHLLRPLVWEAAVRMLGGQGRRVHYPLIRLLRLRLPEAADERLQAAYAALLSLAIPTLLAFARLRGEQALDRLARRLATHAAQAHHSLTQAIILRLGQLLAAEILENLEAASRQEHLPALLGETYREIYPTTQDVLDRKVAERAAAGDGLPDLKHLAVPYDFDGRYGGQRTGREVPSTKGRALNWGLPHIDGRSSWCGFYDAESRPDPRVLLYVAHRILQAKVWGLQLPRLFQGPVFQVRNWYEMGPFCKIASLYQAVAHDWYLPALFRKLPFVGGTNLIVEVELLRKIGGYDAAALTEDLELGTRAYLEEDAWPEYLPYPSSEQTPPTFRSFYRQRLRWATGHLQVMAKVKADPRWPVEKKRRLLRTLWRKGQAEWVFYQSATLVPPLVILLWWFDLVDPNILPAAWHWAMNLLSSVYLLFTVYAFFRYLSHLDQTARPQRWMGQLGAMAQLLLLPLAAFLFPVPYSSALVLWGLGKAPQHWVKTPRTRE
jgi:cellulose synthase/poly-beta-1,6-N-acetylglucosamine synthase-like glycosyltransferase